jgi:hypothetical protein
MPNQEYKLEVILTDKQQKTKQLTDDEPMKGKAPTKIPTQGEENVKFLDKIKNSGSFKAGGSIVGAGIAVGKEIYDYKLTSAQSLGYDNKSLRMQEGMNNVKRGATLVAGIGLVATGNPLGLVVIGYQALELAKDNRQRVIAMELDSIQSDKQTKRLITNTTGRSRE